jgi:tetratricopeptide (TPR) repeat protein
MEIEDAFACAVEHHRAGRLREAEPLYRHVLEREPDHSDALHFLGVIAQQIGDPESALHLIQRAIRQSPESAPYHNNLGEAQRALGLIDDAAASYRRALELDPGFSTAHNNLANVLADAGDREEALAGYDRAVEFEPDDSGILFNRANLLLDMGRVEDAIAAYGRLLEVFPDYGDAWHVYGLVLETQGRFRDAKAAMERAVTLAPEHTDRRAAFERLQWKSVRELLANADSARARGDWSGAAELYRDVIVLDEESAAAYYGIGLVCRAQENLAGAIESLDRAVRIQPMFEDAHAALGDILLEESDDRSDFEGQMDGRRAAALTAVAMSHFRAERYAQAEHAAKNAAELLGAALKADKNDNESWTLLGVALRSIRDVVGSEALLRGQLKALGL